MTEAWQESGQDWVTVCFSVSMVDYTVDDATGAVVEGSAAPVDIEEHWTFTRPVGPKPWRPSAIQNTESLRRRALKRALHWLVRLVAVGVLLVVGVAVALSRRAHPSPAPARS